MPKHNAPKINWAPISTRIADIVERLTEQNFCIDVAERILRHLQSGLIWRNDLNQPVISAFWSKETLEHFKLNNFKPLLEREVYIESNDYSYLNLTEMNTNNIKSGETTYVVDLLFDTTDTKRGEDLNTWISINQDFKESLRSKWMADVLAYWIKEDRLVTRKKKMPKLDEYWNYEDYVRMTRVWDPELNISIVFITGTYDLYKN